LEEASFFAGLLAFFALAFPIFISSCCFGRIRTSAPIRLFVAFKSSFEELPMTKPNLSAARAKLDWADRQINVLDAEIRGFLEEKPYAISIDSETEPGIRYYVMDQTGPIPDIISAGIGAVIAPQRESLDMLATALAKNNGATKPNDVYFPVCKSEAIFREAITSKKIRELSSLDRAIIESLKPYLGGNDLLYALHALNIKSKHHDLLTVFGNATQFGMGVKEGQGGGYIRRIAVWPWNNSPYPGKPCVFFDADPQMELKVSVDVAFREVGPAHSQPVIETLREFSRLANSIISLFD
jgi:hypothetical protein